MNELWKSKATGIVYEVVRKTEGTVWYLLENLYTFEQNCAADVFYAAHDFVGEKT
jgi:hypothetical protein